VPPGRRIGDWVNPQPIGADHAMGFMQFPLETGAAGGVRHDLRGATGGPWRQPGRRGPGAELGPAASAGVRASGRLPIPSPGWVQRIPRWLANLAAHMTPSAVTNQCVAGALGTWAMMHPADPRWNPRLPSSETQSTSTASRRRRTVFDYYPCAVPLPVGIAIIIAVLAIPHLYTLASGHPLPQRWLIPKGGWPPRQPRLGALGRILAYLGGSRLVLRVYQAVPSGTKPLDPHEGAMSSVTRSTAFHVSPAHVIIGMAFSRVDEAPPVCVEIAMRHQLHVYDPQAETLHSPR
jgi:hypothetical protein